MKKLTNDKKGYSLVELMVVIAIMAILAASSTPIFTGYIKKAKSAECLAECRAVYMAAESYLIEHGETFDGSESDLEELVAEVEEITTLPVGVSLSKNKMNSSEYGIQIKKNDEWTCEKITCMINNEIWVLDIESGEFSEME